MMGVGALPVLQAATLTGNPGLASFAGIAGGLVRFCALWHPLRLA